MADHIASANGELFNKNLNKLKHELELWREAVLVADTVLKWDKPAYAGIVAAAVTIAYIFIWYVDLSVLTLLSLLGIAVVVLDYAYPIVARMVFRPDHWTGLQEKRYESVCGEICAVRMRVCAVCQALFVGKEEKSTKYYITTVLTLFVSAYIGASVDNLLLCYLVTLVVALYPGLQTHGFVQTAQTKVFAFVGTHLQLIKQKVTAVTAGPAAAASAPAAADKKAE